MKYYWLIVQCLAGELNCVSGGYYVECYDNTYIVLDVNTQCFNQTYPHHNVSNMRIGRHKSTSCPASSIVYENERNENIIRSICFTGTECAEITKTEKEVKVDTMILFENDLSEKMYPAKLSIQAISENAACSSGWMQNVTDDEENDKRLRRSESNNTNMIDVVNPGVNSIDSGEVVSEIIVNRNHTPQEYVILGSRVEVKFHSVAKMDTGFHIHQCVASNGENKTSDYYSEIVIVADGCIKNFGEEILFKNVNASFSQIDGNISFEFDQFAFRKPNVNEFSLEFTLECALALSETPVCDGQIEERRNSDYIEFRTWGKRWKLVDGRNSVNDCTDPIITQGDNEVIPTSSSHCLTAAENIIIMWTICVLILYH